MRLPWVAPSSGVGRVTETVATRHLMNIYLSVIEFYSFVIY
jgi:hypothetical protein